MSRSSRLPRYMIPFCIAALWMFILGGCANLAPVRSVPVEEQPGLFIAPTFQPTLAPTKANNTGAGTQAVACANNLQFLNDLTIPDHTQLAPGTSMDKEWQVKNNGTCNWGEKYTVRLISGPDLGAASPQALIPARNGAEAVVHITITAPSEPGKYESTWRAFGPDDQPFGEWFSVIIVVTSP